MQKSAMPAATRPATEYHRTDLKVVSNTDQIANFDQMSRTVDQRIDALKAAEDAEDMWDNMPI